MQSKVMIQGKRAKYNNAKKFKKITWKNAAK